MAGFKGDDLPRITIVIKPRAGLDRRRTSSREKEIRRPCARVANDRELLIESSSPAAS
jgi:hypothetical protein